MDHLLNEIIGLDTITSYNIDNGTWYKASEVGDAMDYNKSRKALYKIISGHQDDFKGMTRVIKVPGKSFNPVTQKEYTAHRETLVINKEGIIRLLIYSSMPIAERFKEALIKKMAH